MRRDLGSFGSLIVNNFFLFVMLLVAGTTSSKLPPWSAFPFFGLMGLPLLFPLASDPMEKIPSERLALWPLRRWHRMGLRAASLALSPMVWLLGLYAVKTGMGVVALCILVGAVTVTARIPRFRVAGFVPLLRGRLGGLITNHVRGMLSVLDTWVALLLSVVGTVWRVTARHPDPEALPVLAMMVALALSTQTQALFGLDAGSGETLYRILPVRDREVLLAKDTAWLAVLVLLIAPLELKAGLTFGLAALAVGHHASVRLRLRLKRWRFAGGRFWPVGAVQIAISVWLGLAVMRRGEWALWVAAGLYGASVWVYGRR